MQRTQIDSMLPRRAMIKRLVFAIATLAVARSKANEDAGCGGPLLERAIERAGGPGALQKSVVLKWAGKARIFADDKHIDIGLSTTVAPFTYARSDSWPVEEGPKATRSLIIDGKKGWLVRNGARSQMPEAMLKHEQAQYALYGLMRLVTLCDPGCHLAVDDGNRKIVVAHYAAPKTVLSFDADGRLASARNEVPAPDGLTTLGQQIEFADTILSKGGIRWPRQLKIAQHGKPYFELELTTFDAGAAIPETEGPAKSQ